MNPEEFTGLSARFNDKTNARNSRNIIDAGGSSGRLTSIWLICWGPDTINLRYPKGMMDSGGLTMEDRGRDDVQDEDGNEFTVLKTIYRWKCGVSIKDWRYVVRIANIPVDTLAVNAGTYDLWNALIQAQHRLFNIRQGNCYFYMNRTVRQYLDLQSFNKNNVQYGQQEVNGALVDSFRQIPFRVTDALTNNEAVVS